MVIVLKDVENYDKTNSDYFSNMLSIDPEITEEKLLEFVENEEATVFIIDNYTVKKYIYSKIKEMGVTTAVIIHEKDLKLFNSNELKEKFIDIRKIKTGS